jgi:tetratricopeptide (TPR) repeat protein
MSNPRLNQLRQFVEEEPGDPFNVYALALELRPHAPAEAIRLFDQLLTDHPTYLATYYQAAALLADLGQPDRAFAVYDRGIVLATAQQKDRTRQELTRARQALLDELLND